MTASDRSVSQPAPRQARWYLGAFVVALLPFLLFWQIWWPDPRHRLAFASGDFIDQYYPMRAFVAAELHHGRLPLWDPYTYSGLPAAGASLFAPFYPVGLWQAILFPPLPVAALELEAVFHLSLAGVFTLLFVRQLTGRTAAGLIAGLAFSLGGFLTSYPMLQLGILETAVWLPLILWLIEVGLARRALSRIALGGLVLGIAILAGHPQTLLYAAYVIAAYLLFRAWRLRIGWRFLLAAAGVLGGVALALSAPHWLSSLELAQLSPRAHLSYADVSGGFAPSELWGILRPNLGQWSPLYVGIVPLILSAAGLVLWRQAETWFWGAVALVALVVALGHNGLLYPLFYRVLPGFSVFRNQERAAYVVSLALSVLAGYGYASLARQRWWPRFALPLLAALTFLDLFRANNGVILQAPPPEGFFARTPVVQHLLQVSAPGWRTSSEGLLPGDGNAGLVFNIRDISGNNPLHLESYDLFLDSVPELRWWQMLNVQHVLTQRTLDHGALKLVEEEDGKRLYQIFLGAKPAWITHQYQATGDQKSAVQLAADPGLDPLEVAVLEQEPDPSPRPANGAEDVQLVSFAHQRVALDATLTAPGLLVLSEVAYPGWVARVDGRKVTPLRAYGLLRAIALPAGRWQVEWRYEPISLWLGLAVSLSTVLVVGGWQVLHKRRCVR